VGLCLKFYSVPAKVFAAVENDQFLFWVDHD
jgi:hypothetical protein